MEFSNFIDRLKEAGYEAGDNADHDSIFALWKECLTTKQAPVAKLQCSDGLSLPCSLADELFENCWTATSKLESQLMRDLELPEAYKKIIDKSFASLRKLDNIIKAR